MFYVRFVNISPIIKVPLDNNPNGLYLGTPGSGKSFAAKREIINVFLTTNDRIIIVDPMGEYAPLVRRLGGEVIEISPDSPHHINPMDIDLTDNGEESPLALKADFILSLMELVVGGKDGLQPIERTVIDRCTRLVYHEIMKNPDTAEMPILQDLYELLKEQPEAEAKRLATALEIYCVGSLNVFNNRSNVSTDKRVTCIVLNKLGAGLRKIAMHVTNELSWAVVEENFRHGKFTWCYYDEFHILLRDALTASYFVAIWKMLRKKGCVPSALTQNVKDLLASKEIENILEKLCCKGGMSNSLLLQTDSRIIRSSLKRYSQREAITKQGRFRGTYLKLGEFYHAHKYKRLHAAERRKNGSHNVHSARRLSSAGHPIERPAQRAAARQIWTKKAGISQRTPTRALRITIAVRTAIPAF